MLSETDKYFDKLKMYALYKDWKCLFLLIYVGVPGPSPLFNVYYLLTRTLSNLNSSLLETDFKGVTILLQ